MPDSEDRRPPSPEWIARGGQASAPGYSRTPARSPDQAAGIRHESAAPNSRQYCKPSPLIGTGSRAGLGGQEIREVVECETAYLVNVDPQNDYPTFFIPGLNA